MMKIDIYGDFYNLETHMTAYGVAHTLSGSRISWEEGKVSVHHEHDDVAEALESAVRKVIDPDVGWLTRGASRSSNKGYNSEKSPTVSPFVRVSKGSSAAADIFAAVYRQRDAMFDAIGVDAAESVVKMGKPMYWGGEVPARGGSQLLNHIGNPKNDLLVTNFLTPSVEVLELNGNDLIRVLEKGSTERYVATEWAPTPSSAVSSIFALIGMWVFPTVARMGDRSITAGCRARPRRHENYSPWKDRTPVSIEVPVFSAAVSVAKVRSVVSSRAWLDDTPRAASWVKEQGVVSRLVFTPVTLSKAQHYAARGGYGEHVAVP